MNRISGTAAASLLTVLAVVALLSVSDQLATAPAYANPGPDTACPQFILQVHIWTDKPSYTINESIRLHWDATLLGASTAKIVLTGPSGQSQIFHIGNSTISRGHYSLGYLHSTSDYGRWSVGLTGYSSQGCPNWQGSTLFTVQPLNVTTMTSVTQTITQQSTSIQGKPITVAGTVQIIVENPACYPQCLMPSILLTYLSVSPSTCSASMTCTPSNYRLLQTNGSIFSSALNGTKVTVSGLLIVPSSWSCNSFYVPSVCTSGDIYVNKIVHS